MSAERSHAREELQALLDGRLADEAREATERHLESCESCRGELAALRWSKEQMAALPAPTLPPDLTERVRAVLDAEDARADRRYRLPSWLPVAAAATLVALAFLLSFWPGSAPGLVLEVDAAVRGVGAGEIPLAVRDVQPAELERWFAEQGLTFPARVFDFARMDLQLVGGRLHELSAGPAALYAYRRADGTLVVCQMYAGSIPPPGPKGEIHHREDGVEFRTVEVQGAVLVFWQEGDVACVMGSEGLAPEEVRALAFAKAIRV